jgi:hypothetical protein
MNKSLKVLFFLRTRTSYVSGPVPIYMRVTEGDRFEMATQREVNPAKWDNKACRMVYSKKESTRELNYYLDMLQGRVFEAQREMMLKGIDITANKVKSFLLGKDIKDCKTILEVYREHVEEVKGVRERNIETIQVSARFIGRLFEAQRSCRYPFGQAQPPIHYQL